MSQLYGQIQSKDGITRWKPIEAVLQPDGAYGIKVDTELVLDGAQVTISNIKIGSLNQTSSTLKFLKVEEDGTVVVTNDELDVALSTRASEETLANVRTDFLDGNFSIQLTDSDGHMADITPAGRLLVSQQVDAPANTTIVQEGILETVVVAKGVTPAIVNWIIPAGEVVHLQKFTAGGYILKEGAFQNQGKFRLAYQPNGTAVGEQVIDIIYFQGMSDGFRDLSFVTPIGNGIARLQLEVTNWSVEPMEVSSFFRGYY